MRQSVKASNDAKASFEIRLASNIKTNSKSFYSYVRSKQRTKDKVGPLKDNSGKIISDDTEAANCLNNYFVSVFTQENVSNIPVLENKISDELHLKELLIDQHTVKKKN